MKEQYESPQIQLEEFEVENIMLLSSAINDYDDLLGGA